MGGSIGTSLISTFLARQNQIHQMNLATHTSHGDPNFEQSIAAIKAAFVSQGYDAATAAPKALALACHTVQAQANAVSFQSSFWVMSLIVACLAPLPFVMRRPKPGERQPSLSH
jgi:DHA2 family multidrug resistance protein